MKNLLKIKAIKLRQNGKTYSEILEVVTVAKSTLSLWLREVGLSKPQKQRITNKRLQAAAKGAQRKKEIRIIKTGKIKSKASSEIPKINSRDLWLMGVMLYWSEGAKEKDHRTGSMLDFANSDGRMIKLYIKWLIDIVRVNRNGIIFGIYIHENSKLRINKVISYWAEQTGFPKSKFDYVYFKKHNPKTTRKNTNLSYYGMLRVRVRESTDLNRKVTGWAEGVFAQI